MNFLILKILVLNLIALSQPPLSTASCTQQLKNNEWPVDCLIGLKISKAKLSNDTYKSLNTWCFIKTEKLSKKDVPEIFLSLKPPPNCRKVARDKLKLDKAAQLLDGTFLNSFP